MKYKNIKLIIKIIWIISIVLLVVERFVLYPLGLKILILNINPTFINYILFILLLVCPIFFWNFIREKFTWIKIFYNITAIVLILLSLLIYLFSYSEYKYFAFDSPSKNRTLIVEEKSILLFGNSSFYERKFGVFIKSLDKSISTDDGFRPFSNNKYEIEWIDDTTVKLKYDFGSMGIWKSEIIHLD